MGKANVSRQSLVETIATLEAQRGSAGNGPDLNRAIETTLLALREKLAQAQTEPGDRKRQLAVLVADLSGFTALSERMDVERVRDAINAMWRVLDAVVHAWGGHIDQHAGDSLMALFGLPDPRLGDATRAVHAALAMQNELKLFNERARRAADDPTDESWAGDWPGPSMRIGVHSGSVYFALALGDGPAGSRTTAVGDTIAVARRLEKLATAGSVLASDAVRRQAYNQFVFAPAQAGTRARIEGEEAFLVAAERLPAGGYQPGTVAGKVTRMVGRTEQLDRLELALQAAVDSNTPQLAAIIGPPGAGKSRLIHEFEARARLLIGSPVILRAGTQGACPDTPYALIRDLLLRRFNIRPQDSRYAIEQKLRQGLAELEVLEREAPEGAAALPAQSFSLLERLLDAKSAAALPLDEVVTVVASMLRAIAARDAVIIILEGINRADRLSLALIDHLVRNGTAGPVLFLGTVSQPVVDGLASTVPLMEEPFPWFEKEDAFSPVERLIIPPLTSVESRLMATGILDALSPPMRLLDLIVAESGGNPLYIETFIQLLIERGVIVAGEPWRVDMAGAETTHLPAGLLKAIEARLAHLTEVERTVLQSAATFGPLCWDTAVLAMNPAGGVDEIEAALLSLEMKGYLIRDDLYSFAASQAYAFRRDTLREAAIIGVPAAEHPGLHRQAAHWLIANQNDARLSAWFPIDEMIADHFAAAGDEARAGSWRRRGSVAVTPA